MWLLYLSVSRYDHYLRNQHSIQTFYKRNLQTRIQPSVHFQCVGAAFKWMASYIKDRSQVVVIDSEHSKTVLPKYGVPQGSVFGPKKYTIYAKPLWAIIRRHGLAYHFLCRWHTAIHPIQDAGKAQSPSVIKNYLTDIEGWMHTNMLKLNSDKTEVMLFTPKHNSIHMENVTVCFGDINIT